MDDTNSMVALSEKDKEEYFLQKMPNYTEQHMAEI